MLQPSISFIDVGDETGKAQFVTTRDYPGTSTSTTGMFCDWCQFKATLVAGAGDYNTRLWQAKAAAFVPIICMPFGHFILAASGKVITPSLQLDQSHNSQLPLASRPPIHTLASRNSPQLAHTDSCMTMLYRPSSPCGTNGARRLAACSCMKLT